MGTPEFVHRVVGKVQINRPSNYVREICIHKLERRISVTETAKAREQPAGKPRWKRRCGLYSVRYG